MTVRKFLRRAWFIATDQPYENLAHHYPERRGICGHVMSTGQAAQLRRPTVLSEDPDEGIIPQLDAWTAERNRK